MADVGPVRGEALALHDLVDYRLVEPDLGDIVTALMGRSEGDAKGVG